MHCVILLAARLSLFVSEETTKWCGSKFISASQLSQMSFISQSIGRVNFDHYYHRYLPGSWRSDMGFRSGFRGWYLACGDPIVGIEIMHMIRKDPSRSTENCVQSSSFHRTRILASDV